MRTAILGPALVMAILVAAFAAVAQADEYECYKFGTLRFNDHIEALTCYAADSYGNYVFAAGRVSTGGDIHAWQVSIPAGADPDDRDYLGGGTFAPRTFTHLGAVSLGGEPYLGSNAELYVGNGVMWYGSGSSGNLKAYTWSVSGGAISGGRDSGQDVIVNNSVPNSETLAYDEITGAWYCGANEWDFAYEFYHRKIYHLDSAGNWVYDFEHMSLSDVAQDRQDGIEIVLGNLWVSDKDSDRLAMYENLGTVSSPDWRIYDRDGDGVREEDNYDDTFEYLDADGHDVDGMGFGAFKHFWITGGTSGNEGEVLYEVGGGQVGPHVPEPLTATLLLAGVAGLSARRRVGGTGPARDAAHL